MEKKSGFVLPVRTEVANKLSGHKEGPGKRFVFSDEKNNSNGQVYTIVREVKNVKEPMPHVKLHSHNVDSLYLFMGDEPDLKGLEAEVTIGSEVTRVNSPASVYVPKNTEHTYRFIQGSGKYVNIVLVKGGKYNTSYEKRI